MGLKEKCRDVMDICQNLVNRTKISLFYLGGADKVVVRAKKSGEVISYECAPVPFMDMADIDDVVKKMKCEKRERLEILIFSYEYKFTKDDVSKENTYVKEFSLVGKADLIARK